MKSYCKRVGIPLLILTLLVSVMAPLITLAEDPPPSYETDDWTEFNKLEVAERKCGKQYCSRLCNTASYLGNSRRRA